MLQLLPLLLLLLLFLHSYHAHTHIYNGYICSMCIVLSCTNVKIEKTIMCYRWVRLVWLFTQKFKWWCGARTKITWIIDRFLYLRSIFIWDFCCYSLLFRMYFDCIHRANFALVPKLFIFVMCKTTYRFAKWSLFLVLNFMIVVLFDLLLLLAVVSVYVWVWVIIIVSQYAIHLCIIHT